MTPSLQDVQRLARRHRSLVAGLLAAAAVLAALPVLAPPAGRVVTVLTAAHDLTPGTPLSRQDLTMVALPAQLVPDGALDDPGAAVGRAVTGAVRRGEPLTDVRLLGSGLLRTAGLVAAPVRLADTATAALLRAGDRVDVLAAPTAADAPATSAVTVARAVQVLAVPGGDDASTDGGLVVVAATPSVAARLAAAAVGARLSVTVLPGR